MDKDSDSLEAGLLVFIKKYQGAGGCAPHVEAAQSALEEFQKKRPPKVGAFMDGLLVDRIGGKRDAAAGLAHFIVFVCLLCVAKAAVADAVLLDELIRLARNFRGAESILKALDKSAAKVVAEMFLRAARRNHVSGEKEEDVVALVSALQGAAVTEPAVFANISTPKLQKAFADPYPEDPDLKRRRDDQRREVRRSLMLKLQVVRGILDTSRSIPGDCRS